MLSKKKKTVRFSLDLPDRIAGGDAGHVCIIRRDEDMDWGPREANSSQVLTALSTSTRSHRELKFEKNVQYLEVAFFI